MIRILPYFFLCMIFLLGRADRVQSQDLQDKIQACAMSAGDDATYLKDFVVKLEATGPGERPNTYRQTLALRKNITYRFSICNMDNSDGEAVLRVYDNANLILSSWYPSTGKEYRVINFECKKSGYYTIVINFKEGKAGEAIGILSYVGK